MAHLDLVLGREQVAPVRAEALQPGDPRVPPRLVREHGRRRAKHIHRVVARGLETAGFLPVAKPGAGRVRTRHVLSSYP